MSFGAIYLLETAHPRTRKQLTRTYNTAYRTSQTSHTQCSLQLIADVISNSDHITLNTNTPTRMPNTTVQQTTSPDITTVSTQCTTGHRGQLNRHYHQTTYPSSPQLTYDMTTYYNKTDGHSPTTRKLTGHNSRKTQSPLSLRPPYPPT